MKISLFARLVNEETIARGANRGSSVTAKCRRWTFRNCWRAFTTALYQQGKPQALQSLLVLLLALVLVGTGCETEKPQFTQASPEVSNSGGPPPATALALSNATASLPTAVPTGFSPKTEGMVLREGDVVKITFPGAPNLNTTQAIRRDGKINLQLVGEFKAAGMTPSDMEKELLKLYGPQLQVKEVTVAVESAFCVYVTGAVLRPGKICSERPLTALEAIMEAGGFDQTKANLKKVNVNRYEKNRSEHFELNLKRALQEGDKQPFSLKPSDIIFVPERFQWF